jgi:hypothetical protein
MTISKIIYTSVDNWFVYNSINNSLIDLKIAIYISEESKMFKVRNKEVIFVLNCFFSP